MSLASVTEFRSRSPEPLHQDDPIRAKEVFPYRRVFYPLGFAVEIETNSPAVLEIAAQSWSAHDFITSHPPLHIRLGVTEAEARDCPPCPSVRAFGHLLSVIADAENFMLCDLAQSCAFGWVDRGALAHPAFLRYHFLEATALVLVCTSRATAIHAACVSFKGHGFLLCGHSGAGKSTLAYACARAGWTYTSDDASYALWDSARRIRGNFAQFRFRPSARQLFPELEVRPVTPRAEGKPSIEIASSDLPDLSLARESSVDSIVLLRRHKGGSAELSPLSVDQILPFFTAALNPVGDALRKQSDALTCLFAVPIYELRYRDLGAAIRVLERHATTGCDGA